ncbi:hypothetical protein HELRODRAFT_181973 [Helobdella robusta]|uniref:Uncharacterized protein n=1 Tax=Helobdella robusta TaxID=6412 RepID=T1FHJ8_HELRO|nr:hypothetical protein HELRODRAFT_181973 [Helobdella robusta]ESN91918.1 hypothetical protein HELRODRAFT_181973 [Helobdella robusta]
MKYTTCDIDPFQKCSSDNHSFGLLITARSLLELSVGVLQIHFHLKLFPNVNQMFKIPNTDNVDVISSGCTSDVFTNFNGTSFSPAKTNINFEKTNTNKTEYHRKIRLEIIEIATSCLMTPVEKDSECMTSIQLLLISGVYNWKIATRHP